MKRHLMFALLLAASAISTPHASDITNDNVSFGKIGLAGNGCPEETESVSQTLVKLDDTSVRVIPLNFVLSSKQSARKLIRRKCDMALAVKVAKGYQIGISNAAAQSFLALDDASKSSIHLDTGFTGSEFEKEESTFESNTHQNTELLSDTTQWSMCGKDTIIRMKVSATLRTDKSQISYLRVNSFGLDFEYQACS